MLYTLDMTGGIACVSSDSVT